MNCATKSRRSHRSWLPLWSLGTSQRERATPWRHRGLEIGVHGGVELSSFGVVTDVEDVVSNCGRFHWFRETTRAVAQVRGASPSPIVSLASHYDAMRRLFLNKVLRRCMNARHQVSHPLPKYSDTTIPAKRTSSEQRQSLPAWLSVATKDTASGFCLILRCHTPTLSLISREKKAKYSKLARRSAYQTSTRCRRDKT